MPRIPIPLGQSFGKGRSGAPGMQSDATLTAARVRHLLHYDPDTAFVRPEDAHAAYISAAVQAFGEFANGG